MRLIRSLSLLMVVLTTACLTLERPLPAGADSPGRSGSPKTPPPPVATLPSIFGDHMVLQAGQPIPVWGQASAGRQQIRVELIRTSDGSVAAAARTESSRSGAFKALLPTMPWSHEPYLLRISSRGFLPVEYSNVLIGEVWFCSGQSNMAWALRNTDDGAAAVAAATNSTIRLFKVPRLTAIEPAEDVAAEWQVCEPKVAANFSAVSYHFGLTLQQSFEGTPPIGLIDSSYGGTPAESWTSLEALAANNFDHYVEKHGDAVALAVSTPEAEAQYAEWLELHEKSVRFPDREPTPEALTWALPETSAADWPTMPVPGNWERNRGLENLNGVVWLRREFELPEDWADRELTLSLGVIDDADTTWFNGVEVGATGLDVPNHWALPRVYQVPASLVKAGQAVVAVRVFDNYAHGGILRGPQMISLANVDAQPINLAGKWSYQIEYDIREFPKPAKPGVIGSHTPASLYNGMVDPIIPYSIAGFIWYQGESNASRAEEYHQLFPTLIRDWRQRWDQPQLPFLWCQLANFMPWTIDPNADSNWAALRDAQTATLALPSTAQAVLIDVGEADDIHPRDKKTVGERLALAALRTAYGRDLLHSGPVMRKLTRSENSLVVHFDHVGTGLEARGGEVKGFAIAGPDGNYRWADATIEGDTVILRNGEVTNPVAVRYAWANNPVTTLYNSAGLPATPFQARLETP